MSRVTRLKPLCAVLGLLTCLHVYAASEPLYEGQMHMLDDAVFHQVLFEELEWQDAGAEQAFAWDAQGWVGTDFNRLWVKTEGEREEGELHEAALQLLYGRPLDRFWDLQVGVKRDFRPEPERNWLVLGVQGLAPYFFEVDAALFLAEGGQAALRLEAEYELLFTQRLILVPALEIEAHRRDEPLRNIGSGLSESSLGLRLRYEFTRKFAPYVGVEYRRLHGDTAEVAAGEDSDTLWVAGLRFWF